MFSADLLERDRQASVLALKIIDKVKTGEPVSDTDFSDLMKIQGSRPKAVAAKAYIETYREILALNPERNTKMADRILPNGGNFLIVVSNSHAATAQPVSNLKSEFVKKA